MMTFNVYGGANILSHIRRIITVLLHMIRFLLRRISRNPNNLLLTSHVPPTRYYTPVAHRLTHPKVRTNVTHPHLTPNLKIRAVRVTRGLNSQNIRPMRIRAMRTRTTLPKNLNVIPARSLYRVNSFTIPPRPYQRPTRKQHTKHKPKPQISTTISHNHIKPIHLSNSSNRTIILSRTPNSNHTNAMRLKHTINNFTRRRSAHQAVPIRNHNRAKLLQLKRQLSHTTRNYRRQIQLNHRLRQQHNRTFNKHRIALRPHAHTLYSDIRHSKFLRRVPHPQGSLRPLITTRHHRNLPIHNSRKIVLTPSSRRDNHPSVLRT